MAKDQRLYGKFTLDFPDHPKIAILSDSAFRCLVEATLWSRKQELDGLLPRRYALARWSLDVLQELCSNDTEKPSLYERDEGWYIHDFAEHQETKADIAARRERNRLAGQKGGLAKGKRTAKRSGKPTASEKVSEKLAEEEEVVRAREDTEAQTVVGSDSPRPLCSRHGETNSGTSCAGCATLREWDQAEAARRKADELASRRLRREAIDACDLCDHNGIRDFGNVTSRCTHPDNPPHLQEVS